MFFPGVKRALLKLPTRTSLRTLATSASATTAPLQNATPPIFKDEQDVTDSVMKWLKHDQLQPQASQFSACVEPVYVQLSSLLRQEHSDSSERVAALSPSVFRHPIRRDILHLCVVHYLDGIRQGTAANKTRGEVRGSGAKIRPQKGTGRARLGDAQSPMLRGGGRAFAKKARDFSTQLPRKVIQMGMRVALSAKVKEDSLGIVESLEWSGLKTKDLAQRIGELGWNKTLFVTGQEKVPETLMRSSRNIQGIDAVTAAELNVYNMLKWERLVLDVHAVRFYERTLGKKEVDALAGLE
ncbi:ribosomal protein L4 [Ramaria rubella]|nr:ribosomal protein L4 [Ramaria rubella]